MLRALSCSTSRLSVSNWMLLILKATRLRWHFGEPQEAARASDAEKWRHFTISTVFEDGRFDSQIAESIPKDVEASGIDEGRQSDVYCDLARLEV